LAEEETELQQVLTLQEEVKAVNQDFLIPLLHLILRPLAVAVAVLTMPVLIIPLVVQI
jgi:hypothetical protein